MRFRQRRRRRRKGRYCREFADEIMYKPAAVPFDQLEFIEIDLDEFEAVRLCDLEEKSQIEAAEHMQVSRATVQRLLNEGRKKIVEGLLNNQGIRIKPRL